ncbi:MAG: hypothetical protein ACOC08_04565 [Campylobacterales bacterium]
MDEFKKPIDLFHKNFLQKLLLYWETRHLDDRIERIITIFAATIYFDKAIYSEEIEMVKEKLNRLIPNPAKADVIYERVRLKTEEYIEHPEVFDEDLKLAVRYIIDDIQLYSLVKDILEADKTNNPNEEQQLENLIKEEYDRQYHYNKDESRFD